MNLHQTPVVVLGLAREGVSLARYLAEQGALVTVTDGAPVSQLQNRIDQLGDAPIRLELGTESPSVLEGATTLFVSPGVPESNPIFRRAEEIGLPIESMTTLFFDRCPGIIVGITGSSGKTTTTGLIGHLLRESGRDVVVGGNIGDPMLDILPRIQAETLVVLELSSFQLSILRSSPHIAVVTNISPNHLDRHGTMERYVSAKSHIVSHQSDNDWAVLNLNDPEVRSFVQHTPAAVRWFGLDNSDRNGATVQRSVAGIRRDGLFKPVISQSEIPLLGRHNVANVLAAVAACDLMGLEPAEMEAAIRTFRPAPHRLQVVGEHAGVRYVDDSIATSPARAHVALEAIEPPVVLIAGGRDKNLPWDDLARQIAHKARAVILIGEATDLIEGALRENLNGGRLDANSIRRADSLPEAVRAAGEVAQPGDVVLLSPGCTSYDMFRDFEERGRVFAEAVESLDAP